MNECCRNTFGNHFVSGDEKVNRINHLEVQMGLLERENTLQIDADVISVAESQKKRYSPVNFAVNILPANGWPIK